ncbi:MAG: MnmC family methyltransferase [Cyanobacteriota bacterium]|nr:MnmC family methyltransferase [Cyanobacteriota bacterium]
MSHPLGELSALQTADGSLSLHSERFDEAFHSSIGALAEAKAKFVRPAQLERFCRKSVLRVLDVCVGLGYNSAALMNALPKQSAPTLQWWGLELDPRPLSLALMHDTYRALWSPDVLMRLEQLNQTNSWSEEQSEGTLLWGDARSTLQKLPEHWQADLILMDAFSPGRCPELWSEEFLGALAKRLAVGGRLLTYSRSAAIRGSLRRAGLNLRSLQPAPGQRLEWSSGTLAAKPGGLEPLADAGPGWKPLCTMEEEHLNTRAAVPYRDPNGHDDAQQIRNRREQEQQACKKESTSRWQRRWRHRTAGIESS